MGSATFAALNVWSRTPSTTGSYVRLTGWLAGWQTKSRCFSRFSKFIIDDCLLCSIITAVPMQLSRYFQLKPIIVRWVFSGAKKLDSIHSLLIPTIQYYRILNDYDTYIRTYKEFCVGGSKQRTVLYLPYRTAKYATVLY